MTIANEDMAAAWDGPEGEHWAEHADRYERVGVAQGQALLDAAAIGSGDSVLDVGCGTGKSTRGAGRLAVSGSALGIDLSARMLERARSAADAEGLGNVRFEQADAQVHPFGAGAFDVAISSFGAMFFADPVAAFANIRRSLRPGGRLALLAWRELDRNEWLIAIRQALALGRDLPTPPVGAPGPFGLADRGQTEAILTEATFVDVDFVALDDPIVLGADADDAFAFVRDFGITRGLTHGLDDADTAAALDALHNTLVDHQTPTGHGVRFGASAWLVTARTGIRR